jgi:cytochrome c oxidase cbb3-type subunit 3
MKPLLGLSGALALALVLAPCAFADKPAVGHDALAAVPLGDVAGAAPNSGGEIANPQAGNPQAVAQGKQLFIAMNCAGCHGYGAKGGMGPNLTDTYWRYGGVPATIFKSIYEGRPQGMPAWNPALPAEDIWKLVAYIESLGGAFKPEQYRASIQGDRPGENVAPEVQATLTGAAAAASAPTEKTEKTAKPPPASAEARPDAGGTPPGSKP